MKLFKKKEKQEEVVEETTLHEEMLTKLREVFTEAESKQKNSLLCGKQEFGVLLGAVPAILYNFDNFIHVAAKHPLNKEQMLDMLNAENKEDVIMQVRRNVFAGCQCDVEDFMEVQAGTSEIDLEAFAPEAKEAFTSCMAFAHRLLPYTKSFLAWDISEGIKILRFAYMCEFMTLEEVYNEMEFLISVALQTFSSWSDYAISLICGGTYYYYKWGGRNEAKAIDVFDDLVAACVQLLLKEEGAWITHNWIGTQETSAIDILAAVDPEAKAAYDEAMVLYEKGEETQGEEARTYYKEGMAKLPEILLHAEVHALFLAAIGDSYEDEEYKEALPYFEEAWACYDEDEDEDPGKGYVSFRLGMCYAADQNKEAAVKHFTYAYTCIGDKIFHDFDDAYLDYVNK